MFRCRNNMLGVCVACIGMGMMLSAFITRFTLFCGFIIIVAGVFIIVKK